MKQGAPFLLAIAILLVMSKVATAQEFIFKPIIGGFPADSGFSAGAEVIRTRLAGPVDGRVRAIASIRKYELLEVGAEVPELRPWLALKFTSGYSNHPQDRFWGIGNDTQRNQRTNYLIETFDTTSGVQMSLGRVRTGFSGGYMKINTGPGRDTDYPSVPEALQVGPSYGHAGATLEYGTLDDESDPHKGTKYAFEGTTYASAFQIYQMTALKFFPVRMDDRIGLRAQTTFTHNSGTQAIPFFMLPIVGGSDTVRGFEYYRFRDRHALILNAEYRRPLNGFIEAVAFVDAGRVFSHAGDFTLKGLHYSGGLGARLKFGPRVLLGFDVGFSREGARLWFLSDQMF